MQISSPFTHSSREDHSYYMVMEYAAGETLKTLLEREGPMSEGRARKIFLEVLEGVGYAHQKGIVHRDLKPSNIMIGRDDGVKIMDFGIAKMLGNHGMTKTGAKVGTLYYMSPEQVRASKDIDHRTDVYSLGVTFFEMLTGKLPFNVDTESDFHVMKEIVSGDFQDVRAYSAGGVGWWRLPYGVRRRRTGPRGWRAWKSSAVAGWGAGQAGGTSRRERRNWKKPRRR